MSGKPKSTGWGGRREGSGRKPAYMLPDNRVKAMLKRMRRAKKELGIDEDDFLVSLITKGKALWENEKEASIKDALTATKLFKEFTLPKSSEQNINVNKYQGPAIGLPPMRPDPALEILKGGKEGQPAKKGAK